MPDVGGWERGGLLRGELWEVFTRVESSSPRSGPCLPVSAHSVPAARDGRASHD